MRKTPLAIGLLLAIGAAQAADSETFELGVVEVNSEAVDHPQTTAVDVLDRRQMEKHERHDVAHALDMLPGVTLDQKGNRGEYTALVRGFDSRQVPVFIDGIPVYVPYDGNVDLGRFMTGNLAEIRVTKGLSSVIYGPNALGGTIDLVSRRPLSAFEASGAVGTRFDREGDRAVNHGRINLGSNQGSWYAQAGVSYRDRDHFRVADDFDAVDGERENSDLEDRSASLKLAYTPNATDEYALAYYNQQAEKGQPPYVGEDPKFKVRQWRWPEWDKEGIYFISHTALGETGYVESRLYHDKFDNTLIGYKDDTYTDYRWRSVYDDHTTGASLEGGWQAGRHAIRLAGHYKRDYHEEIDPDAPADPHPEYEDETVSVAAEDTVTFTERLKVTFGASVDRQDTVTAKDFDNATFGELETGADEAANLQAQLHYALDPNHDLFAEAGQRTRFATIKERYSRSFGRKKPNPDLEAETANHFELGLDGMDPGRHHYRVAVFYSALEDAIERGATDDPNYEFQLQNVGEADHYGIEFSGGMNLGARTRLAGNYSYVRKDLEGDLVATDMPEHQAFAEIEHDLGDRWTLMGTAEYASERYAFSYTDDEHVADGYTLLGLQARYQRSQWDLTAGIDNLADADYALEEGFPEPGRTFYVTAGFRL